MEQDDVVGKVVAALEMPPNHAKRVQAALEELGQQGKVFLGITSVGLGNH